MLVKMVNENPIYIALLIHTQAPPSQSKSNKTNAGMAGKPRWKKCYFLMGRIFPVD